MKVAPMGVLPQPASAAMPVSGDGLLAQLQWRRALEQAQWELGGRFRSEGEESGNPHRAIPSAPATATAAGLQEAAALGLAGAGTARAPGSGADLAAPGADAAPVPAPDAGAAQPSRPDLPSSTLDPAQAATIRERTTLQAVIEQCVQSGARFADTKWSPVAVQVWLDGRKLNVTMRDARISEEEEAEIHRRLAERLAGMGLELNELIINGHPVSPARAG